MPDIVTVSESIWIFLSYVKRPTHSCRSLATLVYVIICSTQQLWRHASSKLARNFRITQANITHQLTGFQQDFPAFNRQRIIDKCPYLPLYSPYHLDSYSFCCISLMDDSSLFLNYAFSRIMIFLVQILRNTGLSTLKKMEYGLNCEL